MRQKLGLHLPERQIGLSAHDFQQAMGAAEVVLTRAIRDAEAPTVPSRWVLRLTNLLRGLGDEGATAYAASKARGDTLISLAHALDRPTAALTPAPRPAPRPPVTARPAKLAVTRVETLVRDPYAIYAQYVLGLRPLRPLGRDPDARERGTISHKVLQRFVADTSDGLPEDATAAFDTIAEQVMALTAPWPAERTLWLARLGSFRDWFLDTEIQRRTRAKPMRQEARGGVDLTDTPRPFRLEATADRIDLTTAGTIAIYDYKSTLPSGKQVRNFALQLPLEAAIAERGGFEGIAPTRPAHLELIGMAGGGKSLSLEDTMSEGDLDTLVAESWSRLVAMITEYQDPATPFTARLRPHSITFSGDFDHLSRLGEWADGDAFAPEDVG